MSSALILVLIMPGLASAQPADAKKPEAEAEAAPLPLSQSLTGIAKAEFEAGKILFQDDDYANAIVKFERAYELSKDPRLLWNIALCEKNLRRYTRMIASLDRYRNEKSNLVTAQDKADAAELIETVNAFVSELKLTVNEPGAQVFVDETEVGTTPLDKRVLVDVGPRRIRVLKPGYKPVEQALQVTGGGEVKLGVMLEKEVHRGRLSVKAGPGDLIAVDGKAMGKAHWEGVLPSGGHTLRVSAPGMAIYQSEVLIRDDQLRQVQVTLNPLPKSNLNTWLWIAGGVALTAGAAIGGALLFQPSEAPLPQGTLGTQQLSFGGR